MANKPTPKGKEIFGLDKIPDHILNKQLMLERGQRESYILELEDKNKKLETALKLSFKWAKEFINSNHPDYKIIEQALNK